MGKNGILKNKAGEQIFPATTADQVAWDKTTNLKQAMAKQDARISNLAKLPSGSTTGDAELQDIRTGEDGTVYDNAGEAVRGQIGQLKESLKNATVTDGSITTSKIADKAVTGDKIDFIDKKEFHFYTPTGDANAENESANNRNYMIPFEVGTPYIYMIMQTR